MTETNSEIILADTSCLILLDKINHLYLLNALAEKVWVTPEVKAEFGQPLPQWISERRYSNQNLKRELDPGEASALALALEIPIMEDLLIAVLKLAGEE